MRKLLLFVAICLLSLAQPAQAQFCPGVSPWVFDDVPVGDPFCGYITWAAQHGITLGCAVIDANHRLYCPNDAVTRSQVAAFLNRLGNVRVEAVGTGPGLTGGPITGIGTINLATTQLLPTTPCANNQIARWNGSAWVCSADANSGGTVTSVGSGTGLAGGPVTTSGSLSIASGYQLPQGCANGQVAKSNGSNAWTCASDANAGGTVTSVATGTGLTGGPITTTGTINLASTQLLPTAACASGQVPGWNGSAWACVTPGAFTGNISLPDSTATVGKIIKPGGVFIHNFGTENTFAGVLAGNFAMTGTGNAGFGFRALQSNTTGAVNAANGWYALSSNTTGYNNTANGSSALFSNTTGYGNTADGAVALGANTTGSGNTAIGRYAMLNHTTGDSNAALGHMALVANTTGSLNTALGYQANAAANNLSNATAIGANAVVDASNHVRIGDTNVTQIGGQVAWSNLSDRREKKDIRETSLGLDFVMALRPVEYRMRSGNERLDLGFVAQDVEALLGTSYNLVAVGSTAERKLSLRYTDLIAPMVKAIQQQQAMLEEQRAAMAAERAQHQAEIADLRRAVEVLMARTSPEGRVAAK